MLPLAEMPTFSLVASEVVLSRDIDQLRNVWDD